MRSSRSGLTLIEILVTATLLSVVAIGFLQFSRIASKSQSNLSKNGEMASIDLGMRSILANNSACVKTASHIVLTNAAPQAATLYDAAGNAAFVPGSTTNGVLISVLNATSTGPDNGVFFVRYDVTLQKVGDMIGQQNYTYLYMTNVSVDGANNAIGCFISPGQTTYTLLKAETVIVPVTNVGSGQVQLIGNPPPPAQNPQYPWSGAVPAPDEHTVPTPPCAAGDLNCFLGPQSPAFQALGNRILLTVSGSSGLATTIQLGPLAFGGSEELIMYDANNGVKFDATVFNQAYGTGLTGFSGGTFTSQQFDVTTIANAYYTFAVRSHISQNTMAGPPTNSTAGYAMGYGPVDVRLMHYAYSP